LKFVLADTNDGDVAKFYTVTITAMVGIAPGIRVGMHLNSARANHLSRLLAPPTDYLSLKFVRADTNNGDVAVYHKNHKNPPKSRFRQLHHRHGWYRA
jgi:hypothetical protein